LRKLGCLGLLLILAGIVAGFVALQLWGGPGPARRNTTVQIADGTSLASASAQLEKAGAIRSATQFRLFARLFGSGAAIKAGEYRIPAHLSASDVLKLLQGGKTLQRMVTIPEGWPSVLVAQAIMKADGMTGKVSPPIEGTVLPDSYAFDRDQPRQALLDRMQGAMVRYLAQAWSNRAPNIAVHTPREALILASIVEKETGKPEERRMVAAVYSNRLKLGMKLQADPTIIYPHTRGLPLGKRIPGPWVTEQNGYNTYAMVGLPAGPICNPGRASIDAVLNPAQSNALYFVADGSGGHVFADTLEQHNANVAKWRAYRAAHGI